MIPSERTETEYKYLILNTFDVVYTTDYTNTEPTISKGNFKKGASSLICNELIIIISFRIRVVRGTSPNPI